MLYFLYGTDTDKARAKAAELVAGSQKKRPEAELFRLDLDNWNTTKLDEFSGSQGLFERKFIVFANGLFENKEVKAELLEKLSELAQSENLFIFLERALDKAALLAVTKVAQKVQAFEKTETKKEGPFNLFSLANTLRARDRKGLWVLYQKALRNEASPEALSGILFWQIKDLLLKRSNNFSPEELSKLAMELITLYHDAHRGLVDFETGLERFILAV